MKSCRSGAISSYLQKYQYIEFLKYCQKHNLSKSRVIQNAIIGYCNIQNIPNTSNKIRKQIAEELADILKKVQN